MLTKSLVECQAYHRDRERVSMNEISRDRLATAAHSIPAKSLRPYALFVAIWQRRPRVKAHSTPRPLQILPTE